VPLPVGGVLAEADEERQADLLVAAIAGANVLPPGDAAAILSGQRSHHLDALAIRRYRPRPYAGRVVLYRATEPSPHDTMFWQVRPDDPALGWGEYCPGGLEVVPVSGHHYSLLDPPQVEVIARHLRAALRTGAHPM
jgi:thioesterase domain-containing protein